MQPLTKRIIIIVCFIVLFSLGAFLLYLFFSPAATCFDKKQNQAEKGVDCGGPCSPCKAAINPVDLTISEVTFTTGGNSTFDAVVKIVNPNETLGAKNFSYTFRLKDAQGNVVASREGQNFILPSDTKYVAQLGITTQNNEVPTSIELVINDIQWDKLGDVEKPQLGIYSKKFDKMPVGEGSEADGDVRNESGYDLKKISLVVVLRDEKGAVIGINTTEKNDVRVKEDRDFRLTWPYALPGQVQSMEVDAQSNVFDPQNFSIAN